MRSQSMAWFASLCGYDTYTLEGGYKGFQHTVLDAFSISANLVVVGGYSGSGKTAMRRALACDGQQVVDLEGLAQHKGSAFGSLGEPLQPSALLPRHRANDGLGPLQRIIVKRGTWDITHAGHHAKKILERPQLFQLAELIHEILQVELFVDHAFL